MTDRLYHPLITPERLRKRALIYVRQSTMHQVRENTGSTALQLDQTNIARLYGWPEPLIDVIDEDLGRSGASTRHRTGWQEMLHRLSSGTVGAVFTFNVSRLSREMRDFEELRVMAKLYDIPLIIDGRPADPSDPNDTVLLQVQAAFAQHDNHTRARALSRARREKAKRGIVVSRLPIGWMGLPEGGYAFDPVVQAAIMDVHATFRRERSVLATVRALIRAGKKLPVRNRGRIIWRDPQAATVRDLLVNLAYTGAYVYGVTENRPDLGMRPDGYPKRRRAPEEKWIVNPDHHPAYLSREEQGEFKQILAAKCFSRRQRPGRGSALLQGLLYCARCGVRLSVLYPLRSRHRYECQKNPTTFGRLGCFNFRGLDADQRIERFVLSLMAAPPIEELMRALAEARVGARAERDRVEAEHKRLLYNERLARDRYEQCDPRNRLVAADAEERLEKAMLARIAFEQQQATARTPVNVEGSEEEIEALCELVRDIPGLWRHPLVTDQDRKEILASLIERIPIDVTAEKITGEIHWRTGARSEFWVLRRAGVHQYILDLHDQGLTVPEIGCKLLQPHPETGQTWTYCRTSLHRIIRSSGRVPNRRRKAA
jgi:DNA invertase Pin-like site-specific DNA recombinase